MIELYLWKEAPERYRELFPQMTVGKPKWIAFIPGEYDDEYLDLFEDGVRLTFYFKWFEEMNGWLAQSPGV